MMWFVTKKKLLELMVEIAENERVDMPTTQEDFYFRMGNHNALEMLCRKLDLDLTMAIALKRIRSKEI